MLLSICSFLAGKVLAQCIFIPVEVCVSFMKPIVEIGGQTMLGACNAIIF
jgi:hypothetical protein